MRVVGVIRHNFLPPSETFIYHSLRAVDRYRVRVLALRRECAEKFPMDEVTSLDGLDALLYRTTTWSPRFFEWAREAHILHAQFGYTGAHALLASRRLGLPLVTSFYGYDVPMLRRASRLWPTFWHYALLNRLLFAAGDRFIVLSDHMRNALEACGCPPEKIRTVPLAVDTQAFAPGCRSTGRRITVLMVGREVDKKGFDDGLRACAAARALGADLRIVFVGPGGPLRRKLVLLASRLRLPVDWPSSRRTLVSEAMASADVLLVPSRTASDGDEEGTPTVIYEAAAAELPVISTRHAGIPEQIEDGVTGLLTEERNVRGLATHLVRIAGDPELRRELGRAARARVLANWTLEHHRMRVQSIYDELL